MIAPRSSQSLFRDPAVDPDFDYTRANKL